MENIKQNSKGKSKKPKLAKVSTEEKIHILANIIIDRIIEEIQNGNLNLFSQKTK